MQGLPSSIATAGVVATQCAVASQRMMPLQMLSEQDDPSARGEWVTPPNGLHESAVQGLKSSIYIICIVSILIRRLKILLERWQS